MQIEERINGATTTTPPRRAAHSDADSSNRPIARKRPTNEGLLSAGDFAAVLQTMESAASRQDARMLKPDDMFEAPRGSAMESLRAEVAEGQRRSELRQERPSDAIEQNVGGTLGRASKVSTLGLTPKSRAVGDAQQPLVISLHKDQTLPKATGQSRASSTINHLANNVDQAGGPATATRPADLVASTETSRNPVLQTSVQATPMIAPPIGQTEAGANLADQVGQLLRTPPNSSTAVDRAGLIETSNGPRTREPTFADKPRNSKEAESQHTAQSISPGAAEASEPAGFDELVRSLRLRLGVGRSSARMQLDPPQLGRMVVDVRMERGNVEIDVRTETDEARAIVIERAAELRIALEAQGIPVDRLDVRAGLTSDHRFDAGGQSRRGAGSLPEAETGDTDWAEFHEFVERSGAEKRIANRRRRLDVRV